MEIQSKILDEGVQTEDLSNVKLYTITDAAKAMGIAVNAVRKFVAQGRLKYISQGTKKLIPHIQIEEFIQNELSL